MGINVLDRSPDRLLDTIDAYKGENLLEAKGNPVKKMYHMLWVQDKK